MEVSSRIAGLRVAPRVSASRDGRMPAPFTPPTFTVDGGGDGGGFGRARGRRREGCGWEMGERERAVRAGRRARVGSFTRCPKARFRAPDAAAFATNDRARSQGRALGGGGVGKGWRDSLFIGAVKQERFSFQARSCSLFGARPRCLRARVGSDADAGCGQKPMASAWGEEAGLEWGRVAGLGGAQADLAE